MMLSAPRFWFWSHDIQPEQVADLNMPRMRLLRLASYRRGPEHLHASPWTSTPSGMH